MTAVASDTVVKLPKRRQAKAPKHDDRIPGVIYGERGGIKACEQSALVLIDHADKYAELHFDEFLYRPRFADRDWTDHDDRELLCALQATHQVPGFGLRQVQTAARTLAYRRRRDSLHDFVNALPAWDETARISRAFAEAWGAPDDELTRAASRNFFIALIARALCPGVQVDTLWVFEGPQGSFKSRSLRALGGPYHAEMTAPIGSPDFFRELRGTWIAEISELDSFRGREASTVKRVLSAPTDRFVEKFQIHAESYPRRNVCTATTNEATYWEDSTGARRLIPIKTGEIRLELIEANRLQWFAEALFAYRAGIAWWTFPESILVAQDDRQNVDPWEDALRGMITRGRRERSGIDPASGAPLYVTVPWPDGWVASAEILRDWLHLEPSQQGRAASTRIGKIMRRLGYEPKQFGKDRERGWAPMANTSATLFDQVSA